jgi:hypothetical protein
VDHHRNTSTYLAFASLCTGAFMAQPSMAALIADAVNACLLCTVIWFAHREGRRK